jgi:two-component system C4-dicarboxylate transport sensor histidine kinase DctB/two-component system sensor histidine kinase TtrS
MAKDRDARQSGVDPQQLVQEMATIKPAARLLRSVAAGRQITELSQSSSMLAHELRQPLFTISMASENLRLLLDRPDTDRQRMRQVASRIAEQVERAQAIIDTTLSTAAGRTEPHDPVDMFEAAASALQIVQSLPSGRDVAFTLQNPGRGLLVGTTRIELEQVFVNLLRNGVESIAQRREAGWSGQGEIDLIVAEQGGEACCVIEDNGAGISAVAAKALFKPFATTKAKGNGLGLLICRNIVARCGGALKLVPRGSQGARAEVRLPLVEPTAN